MKSFETPILLLIFNRPDKTREVFARIQALKPAKLFIAADGPRSGRDGELELCSQTRDVVMQHIDWPCEIQSLFRTENLGCKLAVSSAITWFFEQVEEGVILEDDCLPDPTFFEFCSELLRYYRNIQEIMMISGNCFQPKTRGAYSYFFSRYPHIWGWATWRRAWLKYDLAMKNWPEYRANKSFPTFLVPSFRQKAKKMFDSAYEGKISTWDAQWVYACWVNSGLSVAPNMNLVSNIDCRGTHMKVYDPCINLSHEAMHFPLRHPCEIKPDEAADLFTQSYIYFRGWKRALVLMAKYLWSHLVEHPTCFPGAVRDVWSNCVAEIRHRNAQ